MNTLMLDWSTFWKLFSSSPKPKLQSEAQEWDMPLFLNLSIYFKTNSVPITVRGQLNYLKKYFAGHVEGPWRVQL